MQTRKRKKTRNFLSVDLTVKEMEAIDVAIARESVEKKRLLTRADFLRTLLAKVVPGWPVSFT